MSANEEFKNGILQQNYHSLLS